MDKHKREAKAEDPDRREAVAYAIYRGKNRFSQIWMDADVRQVFHSKLTLSRYLDGLEKEGVITCNRLSHKHVVYHIAPGEKSSWLLAARDANLDPGDIQIFEAILRVRDKAKALDIAVNYLFLRFYEGEIKHVAAKIMGGMPEYRGYLLEDMKVGHKAVDEDWSDDMISWRSRQYHMFLRNLRKRLLRHPKHLQIYLREKPWLDRPIDDENRDLQLVERVLQDKYPNERLVLEEEIRDRIERPRQSGRACD